MLGRLSSVINSAVDVIAPPVPIDEEFVYHWNAVTNFFIDKNSDRKVHVQETRIPIHLSEMLSILNQEEDEDRMDTGPCMEYVIQNKLMDTFCSLATADCPPGMKQQILIFFTKLLSRSKHALLVQTNIHKPSHKLVKMCGEVLASPFEKEEMHFLCIICAKIREDPHLVHCFIEYSSKSSPATPENPRFSLEIPQSPDKTSSPDMKFSLAESLLSMIQSPDNWISVKACEGFLLLCSSLPDAKAVDVLVNHTNFCEYIISRLSSLYGALPFDCLEPSPIDQLEIRWGLSDAEDLNEFKGKRQLSCYLSWLDYINSLLHDCHPDVGASIASIFRQEFLENIIQPMLLSESNVELLITIALLNRSYRLINSAVLLKEFTKFLIGNIKDSSKCLHPLQDRLIQLGNSSNPTEISMLILKLFEEMILKFDENIMHDLVLNSLLNRSYYDNSLADGSVGAENFASVIEDDPFCLNEDFDVSPGSSPASRTMAPGNIHKIINSFLQIVPDEIKSCDHEEEIGFNSYVRDIHNQYEACILRCLDFDWPSEAVEEIVNDGSDSASSDSQPEADKQNPYFSEGFFLSLLFSKLEDIINQPYEISLEVTSLISKLALLPHPNLHEYLLNPLIPLIPGTKSLISVLSKVVNELHSKVVKISEYKDKLQITRELLLGKLTDFESFDHGNVFEAIIVIEEFCKELAAIAFVKYHSSS